MTDEQSDWTRRRFLEKVGAVGGAAAVYETMTALGLIGVPDAWAGPPELARGSGTGKKVVILGAGIGGLTSAYHLRKAGYQVTILEAQKRAGGRNFTARRGDTIIEQSDTHGTTKQTSRMDPGLYVNMGPGRLPYHHYRILHYCRELGVKLEPYVMETSANLYSQTKPPEDTKTLPNRQVTHDTRGYISELLAKAIKRDALDDVLDAGDRDRLLNLLKTFGDLVGSGEDLQFIGTTRSGYQKPISVTQQINRKDPLALKDLLNANFWNNRFYQPQDYLWQPTLFQPVGGMDQIVKGFARKVGELIRYQAVVTRIATGPDAVTVVYRKPDKTGKQHYHSVHADYCISNIPMPVLKGIDANFSPDFKTAVDQVSFTRGCKVGWQANKRFWETQNQIYGGISWTDHVIAQMWYPSNDYFSKKGTMTGAYIPGNHKPPTPADDPAYVFGELSLAQRLQTAREGGAKLHPEIAIDSIVPLDRGVSIAWQNVPFQRGQAADYDPTNDDDNRAYARLLSPDGRFHVVGDQVSPLPGWQEGAIMSAEYVVEMVSGRTPRAVGPAVDTRGRIQAPSSPDVSDY
jgi:monoamine oxidase